VWLVDTSVWVEAFRRGGVAIERFLPFDEIVTTPPVIQEVLQGFADAGAFAVAKDALLALPIIEAPLERERFIEAAEIYRAARRVGVTVRSSADCLIAACAIRHRLGVLHLDRDYDAIARVAPLTSRRVTAGERR
jgi:predicted nucleic acid-binding protein